MALDRYSDKNDEQLKSEIEKLKAELKSRPSRRAINSTKDIDEWFHHTDRTHVRLFEVDTESFLAEVKINGITMRSKKKMENKSFDKASCEETYLETLRKSLANFRDDDLQRELNRRKEASRIHDAKEIHNWFNTVRDYYSKQGLEIHSILEKLETVRELAIYGFVNGDSTYGGE